MLMGGTSSAGTPVEQVLMFPSGTAVVSSAGPIIRVWDIVAGGRCLRAISNHQKTVTALAFNADASRLLTGGLDHMVKVYDVSTYKVMHTMRYPAPILCLAISVRSLFFRPNPTLKVTLQPDGTHIVGGMSDGTLSIRRRQEKGLEAQTPLLGSGGSLFGEELNKVGLGRARDKGKVRPLGDPNEIVVEGQKRKRLKDYDRFLKNFKYSAALDAVLRKVRVLYYIQSKLTQTSGRSTNHYVFSYSRACSPWWTKNCTG